jgi:hypothetical protein
VVVGILSTFSLVSNESEHWGGLWNRCLFIRVEQETARLQQQAGEGAHEHMISDVVKKKARRKSTFWSECSGFSTHILGVSLAAVFHAYAGQTSFSSVAKIGRPLQHHWQDCLQRDPPVGVHGGQCKYGREAPGGVGEPVHGGD